jgi:hypothetical protein
MTIAASAPRTLPAKTLEKLWHVGDVVVVGAVRYKIRALNRKTGKAVLSSCNHIQAEIWWDTTLDKLPRKASV